MHYPENALVVSLVYSSTPFGVNDQNAISSLPNPPYSLHSHILSSSDGYRNHAGLRPSYRTRVLDDGRRALPADQDRVRVRRPLRRSRYGSLSGVRFMISMEIDGLVHFYKDFAEERLFEYTDLIFATQIHDSTGVRFFEETDLVW